MELVTQQQAMSIAQRSQSASLMDIRKDPSAFPRIKNYSPDVLLMEIKSCIMMVYQYRGQRPSNAQEVEMMARSLVAELLSDEFGCETKELSMEEIRRAMRRVGLRQGADMYGINVGSLYNAVLDYMRSEVEDAHQRMLSERRSADNIGVSREEIAKRYASMMDLANRERGL